MISQIPGILVPLIIALLQMISAALALGMIPALWAIGSNKHWMMLLRWTVFWLIISAAAVYGVPRGMAEWRHWVTEPGFKKSSMYFGYFVGVFAAFFVAPEPYRIAQKRMRQERRRMASRGYDVD